MQRLAEAKMTSKTLSPKKNEVNTATQTDVQKVNITIIDTPPITPTVHNNYLTSALKGIPKTLLEKVNISVFYYIFIKKKCCINVLNYTLGSC